MLNEGRGLLLATSGDFSWPPVGTSVGHQRILSHGHGQALELKLGLSQNRYKISFILNSLSENADINASLQ